MTAKDLTDNATLHDLDQPVALFFSYVDADKYDFYLKNKKELIGISNLCQETLIEYLTIRKYPVVSHLDPLAANPATIVVTNTGIQTPFLAAKYARGFALDLLNEINSSKFAKPMSFVLGIRLEQLSSPILHPQEEPSHFAWLKHPDGRFQNFIKYRYGANFISEMYAKAWSLGEDNSELLKHEHDVRNLDEPLYSGRQLILEPTASQARNDLEGRYITFGTLIYRDAARYAKDKGFIHRFGKTPDQRYYDDYGVEQGADTATTPDKQIETIIVPQKNPYLGVEINMVTRRFNIPLEEDIWQAFAEYHRAAYIPKSDFLSRRRLNQLTEAVANDDHARTYMPAGLRIEDLPDIPAAERVEFLEEVLPSKMTDIRYEYLKFQFDNFCKKWAKIKKQTPDNSSEDTAPDGLAKNEKASFSR